MTLEEAKTEITRKRDQLVAYMNGMDRDTLDQGAANHAYTFAEGRLAQIDMDMAVLVQINAL